MCPDEVTGNEESYPAVNAAFELVNLTYQIALTRYEAQQTRLMNIAGIVTATSGALLVFTASVIDPINFEMVEFYVVVLLFVSVLLTVGAGLFFGGLHIANPTYHYKNQLHWTDWEFKKNAVFYAGQDLERTTAVIKWKHKAAATGLILFVGELAAASLWISSQV